MRILIAVASKHGGTYGIATRLRTELEMRGHDADVVRIDGSRCPDGYGGYVVGSAVSPGRWSRAGRQFVHDNLVDLRSKPLWLFSSGPLDDAPRPGDHPDELCILSGAREHRVFAGRMFRKELGPLERIMTAAAHRPEGDFRDWQEIVRWADHIDEELRHLVTTGP